MLHSDEKTWTTDLSIYRAFGRAKKKRNEKTDYKNYARDRRYCVLIIFFGYSRRVVATEREWKGYGTQRLKFMAL